MDLTSGAGDRLIKGRYRLTEVIGRGGMGTVWRGHDETLDRDVAVKEIRLPSGLDDAARAEIVELAMREARATARLSHPGIVTIFDVIDDDGVPIIVMELLDGRSLAEVLREEVRLPYRRVAEIGAEVLDALREAHGAGIVHRDLKPGNVLITDRRVMITDFGVAQRVGEQGDDAEEVLGTPAFMAPEQVENAAASPAADLWSLGATLFHAVEGKPPFEGPDYATVLLTMLTQEPPAPVHAGPLAPLITSLLRKDPDRRPAAEEVAERLAAILDRGGGTAPAAGTPGPGKPAPGPGTRAPAPGTPSAAPAVGSSPPRPAAGTSRPGTASRTAAGAPRPAAGAGRAGSGSPIHVHPAPRMPVRPRTGPQRGGAVVAALAVVAVVAFGWLNFGPAGRNSYSPSPLPTDPLNGVPSVPGSPPGTAPSSPPAGPTAPPPSKVVQATAFSPDGRTVAFGGDSGKVRVYSTSSHRLKHTFATPPDDAEGVDALAFAPDGRTLAVGLEGGEVDLWDVARHRHKKLSGFDDWPKTLRYVSGGRMLVAVGGQGVVGRWAVGTGAYGSSSVPLSSGEFCAVAAVSPDGRYAACVSPGSGVVVWDAEKAKRVAEWPDVSSDGLAFGPDSRSLAFFSGDPGAGSMQIWDVVTRRQTGEVPADSMISSGNALAFSPDGKALAFPSAEENSAYDEDPVGVWRVSGGPRSATIDVRTGVYGVAFSGDGRMLATADDDGGALWDVRSGRRLASWPA